jgi:hypothetical protein
LFEDGTAVAPLDMSMVQPILSGEDMQDPDLLRALTSIPVQIMNGIAVCQVGNTTFPEWGVVVAAAGVNFYYDDGTSDVDGPRSVNLYAGQRANFSSKKANGCVKRMYVAMTVVIPGEPAQTLTADITDVGPKECMSSRGVAVGPKNSYLKGQRFFERLELSIT